jgi:hypothetical protein
LTPFAGKTPQERRKRGIAGQNNDTFPPHSYKTAFSQPQPIAPRNYPPFEKLSSNLVQKIRI